MQLGARVGECITFTRFGPEKWGHGRNGFFPFCDENKPFQRFLIYCRFGLISFLVFLHWTVLLLTCKFPQRESSKGPLLAQKPMSKSVCLFVMFGLGAAGFPSIFF